MTERRGDTVRFYQLLDWLAARVGGPRLLQSCHSGMGWPPRGVYFFYESGESRSVTGAGLRIVRIGTHGLKNGARSTLWGRLSQHRGSSRSGLGNHRGSIFRLLVGVALANRIDIRYLSHGVLPELSEKLRGGWMLTRTQLMKPRQISKPWLASISVRCRSCGLT